MDKLEHANAAAAAMLDVLCIDSLRFVLVVVDVETCDLAISSNIADRKLAQALLSKVASLDSVTTKPEGGSV